ncbi:CZB domain-containing protein [Undibacterium flavidum]|uniref:CZB domain-containing protein n=1 Tax=Undibacterium flavidum TaxID=2762297 RepID=A0ABR6Y9U0_9BURK|nr:CZB domain-containing protein [Undibacterium flavidum]MBC3873353.1 CZB domain-containing protein [Undibacterium flavidum]
MNLDNAVETHAQWKTKLRTAIAKRQQLDLLSLSRDDCCELGQWLHGPGKVSYGRLSAHGDCIHKHVVFHREVAKIAKAVNTQQFELAETMLNAGSAYTQASSALSVSFLRLRKEAGI